MKVSRIMEVVLGKDEHAAKFRFRLRNQNETLDYLRQLEQEPDATKKIQLSTGLVTETLLEVENVFNDEGNAITVEDVKAGRIPSYFLRLLIDAFNAENSKTQGTAKNLLMSA